MYSLIMFFGMVGLYFFMKHLETSKRDILVFCRNLFRYFVSYELQFYSIYCSSPNSLVLSDR